MKTQCSQKINLKNLKNVKNPSPESHRGVWVKKKKRMYVSQVMGWGWGSVLGNKTTSACSHGWLQGRTKLHHHPLFPKCPRMPTVVGGNKHTLMPHSSSHSSLPFLHLFSSISRCWRTFFKVLFFSFSFSYFFFHSSAVSSRFTETVFLMVLALGLKI